jgi:prevent-host-death family protein
MKSLSIREVRKELAQLDELVSREGEIVVTRRGQPIARLLPLRSMRRMPSHADLRASMPRLKKGSEGYIRRERDER